VRLIDNGELERPPVQSRAKIVTTAAPGNAIGNDEAVHNITVCIGGTEAAETLVVIVKRDRREGRPARSGQSDGCVPIGSVDGCRYAVTVHAVEADVQVIDESRRNEEIPADTRVVGKERREESGVHWIRQDR